MDVHYNRSGCPAVIIKKIVWKNLVYKVSSFCFSAVMIFFEPDKPGFRTSCIAPALAVAEKPRTHPFLCDSAIRQMEAVYLSS